MLENDVLIFIDARVHTLAPEGPAGPVAPWSPGWPCVHKMPFFLITTTTNQLKTFLHFSCWRIVVTWCSTHGITETTKVSIKKFFIFWSLQSSELEKVFSVKVSSHLVRSCVTKTQQLTGGPGRP